MEPETDTTTAVVLASAGFALLTLLALLSTSALALLLVIALPGMGSPTPVLWLIFALGVGLRNLVDAGRGMLDPTWRRLIRYILWSAAVLASGAVVILAAD